MSNDSRLLVLYNKSAYVLGTPQPLFVDGVVDVSRSDQPYGLEVRPEADHQGDVDGDIASLLGEWKDIVAENNGERMRFSTGTRIIVLRRLLRNKGMSFSPMMCCDEFQLDTLLSSPDGILYRVGLETDTTGTSTSIPPAHYEYLAEVGCYRASPKVPYYSRRR